MGKQISKEQRDRFLAAWNEAVRAYLPTTDKGAFSPEWGIYMATCVPVLDSFMSIGISALEVQLPYSQASGV